MVYKSTYYITKYKKITRSRASCCSLTVQYDAIYQFRFESPSCFFFGFLLNLYDIEVQEWGMVGFRIRGRVLDREKISQEKIEELVPLLLSWRHTLCSKHTNIAFFIRFFFIVQFIENKSHFSSIHWWSNIIRSTSNLLHVIYILWLYEVLNYNIYLFTLCFDRRSSIDLFQPSFNDRHIFLKDWKQTTACQHFLIITTTIKYVQNWDYICNTESTFTLIYL